MKKILRQIFHTKAERHQLRLDARWKRLLILLLLPVQCFCTNYYFSSSTGNDVTGNGTIGNPYASISKCNSLTLASGDSLLFLSTDTFVGDIIAQRTNIHYSKYNGTTKPIITSFVNGTGWVATGGNIWQSTNTFTNKPNMVVINGVSIPQGRYPDWGTYLYFQSHTYSTYNNSITSSGLPSGVDWGSSGVAQACVREHAYMCDIQTITSQSGTTLNLAAGGNTDNAIDGYGFFIQNDIRTLTVQNEWYWDNVTHKISIYSVGTPPTVQVATLTNLANITLAGVSVENLSFQGCNGNAIDMTNSVVSGNIIRNCTILFAGGSGISASDKDNFTVSGDTIKYVGRTAIDITTALNTTITGNTIVSCGINPGGIGTTGTNFTMRGIRFTSSDNAYSQTVQHNYIDSCGYNGIEWQSFNYLMQYNYVNNACMNLQDGGTFYQGGNNSNSYSAANRIIDHNIANNTQAGLPGLKPGANSPTYGFYMDQRNRDFTFTNNTSANNVGGMGFLSNYGYNMIITGNTFYNNKDAQFKINTSTTGHATDNNYVTRNIFFAKTSSQYTYNLGDLFVYPTSIFSTSDSNYFDRPILENNAVIYYYNYTNPPVTTTYSRVTWTTLFNTLENHSHISPRTVNSQDSIRFPYNNTSSPLVVPLGAKWISMDSVIHDGSITLQPYTSAPLIYYGVSGGGDIAPVIDTIYSTPANIMLPTSSVTLTVVATDTPPNTIVWYQWQQIGGNGTGVINSPNTAVTSVTSMTSGSFIFSVTVTNDAGQIVRDTVTVNVAALKPVCTLPRTQNGITVGQATCQAVEVSSKKKVYWSIRGTQLWGYIDNGTIGITSLRSGFYNIRINGYNFSIKRG